MWRRRPWRPPARRPATAASRSSSRRPTHSSSPADRPRAAWPDLRTPGWDGGPRPLDLNALLDLVAAEPVQPQADPSLVVGHVHLHVGDVDRGIPFYRDLLGFEVMTRLPTAAFMAADGYHHHVAINVWRGVGVPPPPAATVGLRHWTIVYESPAALAERSHGSSAPASPPSRTPTACSSATRGTSPCS